MLKCLGAPASSIFQIYFIQVLLLASIGITAGLAAGALLLLALGSILKNVLPIALANELHAFPLFAAVAFGILITIAFAIWPLELAREFTATALFRSNIQPSAFQLRLQYTAGLILSFLLIGALAFTSFPDPLITFYYFGGVLASFAILFVLAKLLIIVARRVPKSKFTSLHLAVANLHRPRAQRSASYSLWVLGWLCSSRLHNLTAI